MPVRPLVWCAWAVAASLARLGAGEASGLPKGHVVFLADFDSSDALRAWSGRGAFGEGRREGRSLFVHRAEGRAGATVVSAEIPAEALRGHTIRGYAWVRAEDVGEKPRPWNGIKFLLAIETPGGTLWPQAPLPAGTFGWRRTGLTAAIPADASAVRLVLGLEDVDGRAWFDDVKLIVAKPPRRPRPAPPERPIAPVHGVSRLRGAMVSPSIDEEGLRTLGRDWNANAIRWQLVRHGVPGSVNSLQDYDRWLDGELEKLDRALPHCEAYGLYVVVDLHSPPGGKATASGYYGSDHGLFLSPAAQEKFLEVWKKIARRYKDSVPVWAFDLANEPVEDFVEEDCDDWRDLAEKAARAIREIDPERTIVVEAPPWGGPESLADFEPIDLPGIVYSAHMYVPHAFTHQGVHRDSARSYAYPGEIEGKTWDRDALEAALEPVVRFQRTYRVPIYIGEFSAIRWAPEGSAYRYLEDAIAIFESHEWDWTYHAFREWHGWSVEHGEDRSELEPSPVPTEREKLLRAWFAKNEKPLWAKGRAEGRP